MEVVNEEPDFRQRFVTDFRNYMKGKGMAKNYSEFIEECRQIRYDLARYGEREVVKRYVEEHNCSVPEARRYINERR